MNTDTIIEQKKIIKNKNKIYANQRKELLEKVYNIILDEDNCFYSHIIESNDIIKQQIELLYDDILKYFSVSTWSSFKKNLALEKKTLSLIKSLMRDMDAKTETVSGKIRVNNIVINTTKYKIINRNN
jgi:hypothetical protein